MDKQEIKPTRAMERELEILVEFRTIYTAGYGHRHFLLERMAKQGLCKQGGPGFGNAFTISETGKDYYNSQKQ